MGSFPAICSTHTTLKSLPPHEQGKVLECTMRIMISVPLWGQWDVYGGVLCEQWTNSHSFFLGFISALPFCAIAIFWDLILLCYHRQPLFLPSAHSCHTLSMCSFIQVVIQDFSPWGMNTLLRASASGWHFSSNQDLLRAPVSAALPFVSFLIFGI